MPSENARVALKLTGMTNALRTARLKPEPYRAERIAAAAQDIGRLRGALGSAGIVADDATIFDAWARHSEEHAASWLVLYYSDAENLAALLKHVDLDDVPQEAIGDVAP